MPLHHFLIVYDTNAQELLEHADLGHDRETAARTYAEREQRHGMRQGVEIVLIGADSLDTIRRTHSHYFDRSADDPFAELAQPA